MQAEARVPDFAAASVSDTLGALRVDPEKGLPQKEVERRLGEHGYNEVAEEKEHPVLGFLRKFWGISAWLLEAIIILSAILGRYSDVALVAVLLVVNAVISSTQERRAAGVVQALRRRLQVSGRVLRDASWQVVSARELVPGDIVRVRPGDIIPADVKLLAGRLSVDQSSLTGESMDVDKAPNDMVSSGSVVHRGEANGVVVLTGSRTLFGRTTELVQQARPRLHIEEVVSKVVRWLFLIVGALVGLVTVLSLAGGTPVLQIAPLVLVLLLSALPVALPVMLTVSMAAGAKELAKLGVLVTRLSAAEDAATMDVLCVDKTGTITMNRLAVASVIPLDGSTESEILFAGAIASQEANQDPIDVAFLAAAKARRVFDGLAAVTPVSFAPFDAENRRTEAVVEQDGKRLRAMKGAVRTVAGACGLAPEAIDALEARARDMALKGLRTLAVARGPEAGAPTLIGLVTLNDPPRPDARELISELVDLGVAVKMLTGDELPVAAEIGREVGLQNIRRAADLKAATERPDEQSTRVLEEVQGLAEVYPEDKFTVVKQLQAQEHVTGMTGDGVNDAPALREAEVGIAVSSATDIAKGAASVVLTEPGLTNIVALVERGRTIYQRVLTWIVSKIGRTILKSTFVAVAFLVTGRFVVSATVMLLLVFLGDFPTMALARDRARPSRRPETWRIGGFIGVSILMGIAMVLESLLLVGVGWLRFGLAADQNALQTFSFLVLLFLSALSTLSVRERGWFWKTVPSAPVLVAVAGNVVVAIALTFAGIPGIEPLPWWQVLAALAFTAASCLVNDALKVAFITGRIRR